MRCLRLVVGSNTVVTGGRVQTQRDPLPSPFSVLPSSPPLLSSSPLLFGHSAGSALTLLTPPAKLALPSPPSLPLSLPPSSPSRSPAMYAAHDLL